MRDAQLRAGKLVLGGAVGETPEGAVFILKDITKEEVRGPGGEMKAYQANWPSSR